MNGDEGYGVRLQVDSFSFGIGTDAFETDDLAVFASIFLGPDTDSQVPILEVKASQNQKDLVDRVADVS